MTGGTGTSDRYTLGIGLVVLSALVLSTLGIGLRHIEAASGWQILFYRSLSFTLTLALIVGVRSRGKLLSALISVGWKGVVVATLLAMGSTMMVFSMLNTTVANTTFVVSTTPFIAAALGWLILREAVAPSTCGLMGAAIGGIGLMLTDGLQGGGLAGVALAFGVALSAGLMLVMVRGSRDVDMIPALILAGLMTTVVTGFMAPSLDISSHDRWLSFGLGAGQYAIGFALLIAGTRFVPVAQVALLTLIEAVLGPVWVWLWVDETPSTYTLIGGAIVLSATLVQALLGLKSRPPASASDRIA